MYNTQLRSELSQAELVEISRVLHAERLGRYRAAAAEAGVETLRFYVWNCQIAEAFFTPLHFAEIVCRNAMAEALQHRCGADWHADASLRKFMHSSFVGKLDEVVASETQRHRGETTGNHVVSALSFGFWEHLATKRFERYLWPRGFQRNFPNADWSLKLSDLNAALRSARQWRNRIAHHQAIFDKGPAAKYSELIDLIRWRCTTTAAWVEQGCRVSQTLQNRPRK